jgi:hypothetical protein
VEKLSLPLGATSPEQVTSKARDHRYDADQEIRG